MEFRKLVGIAIIVISIVSLVSVIIVSYTGRGAKIIDLVIETNVDSTNGAALIIGRTGSPILYEDLDLYRSGIYSLVLSVDVKPASSNAVVHLRPKTAPQAPSQGPVTVTPIVSRTIDTKATPYIIIEECIVGLYSVTNTAKPWHISLYNNEPNRVANYIKSTADDVYEGLINKDSCSLKVSLDDIKYNIRSIVVFVKISNESTVILTPRGVQNFPQITVRGSETVNFLLGRHAEVEGELPNGTKVIVNILPVFYDSIISIKSMPELDIVSAARAFSLALIGLIIYFGGPRKLVDALEHLMAQRG